jgi:hypothetical protein
MSTTVRQETSQSTLMKDAQMQGLREKGHVAVTKNLPDRTQFAWGQSSKIESRLCWHTVIKDVRGYKVKKTVNHDVARLNF